MHMILAGCLQYVKQKPPLISIGGQSERGLLLLTEMADSSLISILAECTAPEARRGVNAILIAERERERERERVRATRYFTGIRNVKGSLFESTSTLAPSTPVETICRNTSPQPPTLTTFATATQGPANDCSTWQQLLKRLQ